MDKFPRYVGKMKFKHIAQFIISVFYFPLQELKLCSRGSKSLFSTLLGASGSIADSKWCCFCIRNL